METKKRIYLDVKYFYNDHENTSGKDLSAPQTGSSQQKDIYIFIQRQDKEEKVRLDELKVSRWL